MKETKNFRKEQSSKAEAGAGSENSGTLKRIGIVAAVALAAFLPGFVPMWLSARNSDLYFAFMQTRNSGADNHRKVL